MDYAGVSSAKAGSARLGGATGLGGRELALAFPLSKFPLLVCLLSVAHVLSVDIVWLGDTAKNLYKISLSLLTSDKYFGMHLSTQKQL